VDFKDSNDDVDRDDDTLSPLIDDGDN